ncbi:hypothetical protein Cgig2_024875 [Carnegiea gigantea]|uniref:Uncharacterized protein n=1 Tax=Carnegiea gigantea TaxID=171969 RepID=A0A9Q1KEG8_9CARY|nr:hypothetical protein Cgig2_024875 [Carnegiea gigantea]
MMVVCVLSSCNMSLLSVAVPVWAFHSWFCWHGHHLYIAISGSCYVVTGWRHVSHDGGVKEKELWLVSERIYGISGWNLGHYLFLDQPPLFLCSKVYDVHACFDSPDSKTYRAPLEITFINRARMHIVDCWRLSIHAHGLGDMKIPYPKQMALYRILLADVRSCFWLLSNTYS